ncbi:hypothetical protein EVAR_79256_1 [Eumeta japonica]|uniref:Uncharacterized protein n=1 Tax=Eumeta variegata TaxID=151549 RepID=A0A4C1TEH5_EUMVA|nr:hypothetical protein EVAR_79256_1 [Eumeta japonica]
MNNRNPRRVTGVAGLLGRNRIPNGGLVREVDHSSLDKTQQQNLLLHGLISVSVWKAESLGRAPVTTVFSSDGKRTRSST